MGQCFSSEGGASSKSPAKGGHGGGKTGDMFGYPTNFDDEYDTGKELGRGTFGTTYLCTKKDQNEEERKKHTYAVKVILKSSLQGDGDIEDVKREVKIMEALKGKSHVVGLEGAYEDKKSVKLILELCAGGELFERIISKKHYSEKDASAIVRQMLEVVGACHVNGIIHRDLKPENFLFLSEDEDSELKVTDFGLSTFYRHGQRFTEVVGSAYYIAPEVLQRGYGPPCDIWSIGVIMYITLCGRPPFFGRTESAVFNNIMKAKQRLEENFKRDPWPKITPEAKDLIKKMLHMDPTARVTASQALAHDWVRKDGVAPDVPLDVNVVQSLKDFTGYSKLKQLALRHVAMTYSDEEIRDIRDQFSLMDKDGTGTLSLDEMIQALQNMQAGEGRSSIGEDEIKEIVTAMDYDGDGEIDYMEFVTAALHITQQQRGDKDAWQSRIRSAFDKIDSDGNGFIDTKELEEELKASGETPEAIQELIKEHDTNGDGFIDFNEFSAILRNRAASRAKSRKSSARSGKSTGRGKKK
jgi:calcium-dependent protein kinase